MKYQTIWKVMGSSIVTGHYDRNGKFVDVRPVGWTAFEWQTYPPADCYSVRIHAQKGVECDAIWLHNGVAVAVRRDNSYVGLCVTIQFNVRTDEGVFTILLEKDTWIGNHEREMLAKFPVAAEMFAEEKSANDAMKARWKMECIAREKAQADARATLHEDFEKMITDKSSRKIVARWVRTQRNRQQVDDLLRPLQGKYGLYTDDLRAALTDQFREKFTV